MVTVHGIGISISLFQNKTRFTNKIIVLFLFFVFFVYITSGVTSVSVNF